MARPASGRSLRDVDVELGRGAGSVVAVPAVAPLRPARRSTRPSIGSTARRPTSRASAACFGGTAATSTRPCSMVPERHRRDRVRERIEVSVECQTAARRSGRRTHAAGATRSPGNSSATTRKLPLRRVRARVRESGSTDEASCAGGGGGSTDRSAHRRHPHRAPSTSRSAWRRRGRLGASTASAILAACPGVNSLMHASAA